MSSYLLGLIVSDFECLSQIVSNIGLYGNLEVSVCGQKDAVSSGRLNYALNVSSKIIEYYEKFYNVKYPLPKSC
jgi:aminopeptidase N